MTGEETVAAAGELSELVDTLLAAAPTFWETLQRQAVVEGWQSVAWSVVWMIVAAAVTVRGSQVYKANDEQIAKDKATGQPEETNGMTHANALTWYWVLLVLVAIGSGLKAVQFGVIGVGILSNPDYHAIIALSGGG
ncbi:MAG: hypothetical protein HN396_17965 [Gemmatimonadales bacterium]|jgi:hypothetical protein|nr:hypothetical protein [Gemmatimonadales bacterium]MBT7807859.1 hypothetical protein [Candidatus Poribacteria bacterium]